MRMSMMATSGRCSATAASSASPSPTLATARCRPRPAGGQALAQQQRVVGDHDPHGTSASIDRAAAGALADRQRPTAASARSAMPRRPLPRRLGAAAAVVVDQQTSRSVSSRAEHRRCRLRAGVLDRVRDRFAGDEPERLLDRRRRSGRSHVELHRDAACAPPDRRGRPRARRRSGPTDGARWRAPAAPGWRCRSRRRRDRRARGPRSIAGVPSLSSLARSCMASASSRCWAPSCRLRSMRWRSATCAATMRARDSRTSSSWRAISARSRALLELRQRLGGQLGGEPRRRWPDRRGSGQPPRRSARISMSPTSIVAGRPASVTHWFRAGIQ